ncbi:uncharacterized protein LOC132396664 isoform X2 [Hypanus sabinus]|uniref:uncharacterized protein LOC132396664 isoform X2 n=1 Tax=Hypanus sabinus TaxID=79690 RepID=UPI0028C40F83|nr:uncharacterized protein LOC132396664 isoform X2 [Hypanus sabinus]
MGLFHRSFTNPSEIVILRKVSDPQQPANIYIPPTEASLHPCPCSSFQCPVEFSICDIMSALKKNSRFQRFLEFQFVVFCTLVICDVECGLSLILLQNAHEKISGLYMVTSLQWNWLQSPCTPPQLGALDPASLLCFNCKAGISQPFPFVSLIHSILPGDCQLDDKDRSWTKGPDQASGWSLQFQTGR